MPTLNDLTTAIYNRLTTAQGAGGSLLNDAAASVLREDAHDLQTEINKSLGQIGMLILVGMPRFTNKSVTLSNHLQAIVQCSIAVGENPILWRSANRDTAASVALIISQLIHNFPVAGFQNLKVLKADFIPDKKRQLYEIAVETMLVTPVLNQ